VEIRRLLLSDDCGGIGGGLFGVMRQMMI
jgi:hypothetical protein